MRPQRRDNDPSVSLKVGNKMSKLVARGYITEGVVLANTSFFSVPNGIDNIYMVFDATDSGIYDSLWAPNFMLLSMRSLIMMVGPETHMEDLDVGEILYNFRLSLVLANYCGLDLGFYLGHNKDRQAIPIWML